MAQWIDLSKHRAQLSAFRMPDGEPVLALIGVAPSHMHWKMAISLLGFEPSASGKTLLRRGTKVKLEDFRRVFSLAFVREFRPEEIYVDPKAERTADEKKEIIDLKKALPLGLNHLGQEVLEGASGRFLRAENGQPSIRESDTVTPATFLRVSGADDLALCADGFVESMVRGSVMRADDLKRFAAVIHGVEKMDVADARLRLTQEAVEAAIQRRVAKEHLTANEEAFIFASKLTDHMPNLIYRTSGSMANQQYSTPVPMSIAAQRILGDTSRLSGLEPTIGNGSLVMSLPSGTRITGVEIDPARVAQAQRLRAGLQVVQGDITKMEPTKLNGGKPYDFVVCNPPFGRLDKEVTFDGMRVTRIDQLIMLQSLQARKDDGRAVYIIGADHDNLVEANAGEISGGSKNLFNWLADHYEIESAVEVDGRLYEKQGAGYPVRLITVGRRRSPEEAAEARKSKKHRLEGRLPVIRSWDELWTHAESVAARLHEKAPVELDATDVAAPEHERIANDYQSPYIPASKNGQSTSMIPRNMVAATSFALERVAARHGDIDEFVRSRLQLTDEQFADFAPEQVDAIALAIDKVEAGERRDASAGNIVGDMTGRGKGRVVAAMARYAVLRNKPVVFLTDKPNLFSDLWRDIQDIHSGDLFRPFILNAGEAIRDQTNNIVHSATKPSVTKRVMESAQSFAEHGYNIMFATYSQFNREAGSSQKSAWLPTATSGALALLDESHMAAGESNVGSNIDRALETSFGCVYSSATYAKKAQSMRVYGRVFPPSVGVNTLPETLKVGGEPLQEIMSAMLAQDGALVRREHDLSKLTFRTFVDNANLARNEEYSDKLSDILLSMAYVAGDVNKMARELNIEIREELERMQDMPDEMRKGQRLGVSSVNFGSRLYTLLRQYVLAIKVDSTADMAVKALQEGRKPVIVVEQTNESLLKEVIFNDAAEEPEFDTGDESGVELGKPLGAVSSVNRARLSADGQTIIDRLTFRDALQRTLDRLMMLTERNDYGTAERKSIVEYAKSAEERDSLRAVYDRIKGLIADFPDLPVSPIDAISERIRAAGYTCGEVSGRAFSVSTPSGTVIDGATGLPVTAMVVNSRPDNRLQSIFEFNNGGLDAIVLTEAGSTGLSLHSSDRFIDQRQRELFELQIANNVDKRVQFLGRVNRLGQVSHPIITAISSGLPAEIRSLAMQNEKLRKLSANTQSNRDNIAEMRGIPDILNHIGNEVCKEFLINNPMIAHQLDIDMSFEEGEGQLSDEAWFANKLTGRIALLKVAEQRRIYAEITDQYLATIKEMDARGENPFKAQVFDIKAEVVDRQILQGVSVEGNLDASVFDEPVYIATMRWQEEISAIRYERVQSYIKSGQQEMLLHPSAESSQHLNEVSRLQLVISRQIEAVNTRFRELMELSKPKEFKTVAEALADKKDTNIVKSMETKREWLADALTLLKPGTPVIFEDPMRSSRKDGKTCGIVTRISYPQYGREHLLGQYDVRIAVPGESFQREITANQLMSDNVARTWYMNDTYKSERDVFDSAPSGMVTYERSILDGNLFRAAEIAARNGSGRAAIYTDKDGVNHRAIILRKGMTMSDVKNLSVVLSNAGLATRLLVSGHVGAARVDYLCSDSTMDTKRSVTIKGNGREAIIMVPGSRAQGGYVFNNKRLVALTGEFAGTRERMSVKFDASLLPEVVEELYRSGVSLYASSELNDQAAEFEREMLNATTGASKAHRSGSKVAKAA